VGDQEVTESFDRPAFYAAKAGGIRDWWTLLHPPYTLWHLSYVVIGWSLAPDPDPRILVATIGAFFLAVGVAAHALDEFNGRPLKTSIPGWVLITAGVIGLGGALAVGVIGVIHFGPLSPAGIGLMIFMAAGAILVPGYTLELGSGRLHSDWMFAASWGAFPVLVSYFAAAQRITVPAVAAGAGAYWLSRAQRTLSTPARRLRRKTADVTGVTVLTDGRSEPIDRNALLLPLEAALRSLSWAVVVISAAFAGARLTGLD
jgi:hypothetical protein